MADETPPKRPLWSMIETVAVVAIALFFAFTIQAFAVKPYRIPSGSMLPTLHPGQRILVDRFSHLVGSNPAVGDITVFTPPRGAETSACGIAGEGPFYGGGASHASCSRATPAKGSTTFVKRVVGLPGDTIAIRNGHVVRNGQRASEPFASSCGGSECNLAPITVPSGSYFVMGDNRGNSDDSRYWGPVPRGWIIGEAVASYWPLGRLGLF
ncbi:MAG TPA: signal peptidase I [Thermoleophilaceae bacterium]